MSEGEAVFTAIMLAWCVIGVGIIAGLLAYSRIKYGTWLP